jgi:hypothetical protein
VDVDGFYTSKSGFWEGMAVLVNKILNRRYA